MHFVPENKSFWSWTGVVLILIIVLVANIVFGGAVALIMSKYYNIGVKEFLYSVQGNGGKDFATAARWFQTITFLGFMFFPSMLLLAINRTKLTDIVLFNKPNLVKICITISLVLIAIPMIYFFMQQCENANLPSFIKDFAFRMNENRQKMFAQLLYMDGFGDFIWLVAIMALMPALGEELLFRGILQNIFIDKLGLWVAIGLQALLFSVLHFSVYEFLSIFLMGIILGLLAYKFGLIASMVAHFVFNCSSLIVEYLGINGNNLAKQLGENEIHIPLIVCIFSFILVLLILKFGLWAKRLNAPLGA